MSSPKNADRSLRNNQEKQDFSGVTQVDHDIMQVEEPELEDVLEREPEDQPNNMEIEDVGDSEHPIASGTMESDHITAEDYKNAVVEPKDDIL